MVVRAARNVPTLYSASNIAHPTNPIPTSRRICTAGTVSRTRRCRPAPATQATTNKSGGGIRIKGGIRFDVFMIYKLLPNVI